MSSTVENHGPGAQALHSGQGSQSINAAQGQLYNIDRFIQLAINTAPHQASHDLSRLFSEEAEGVRSLLGGRPSTPSLFDITDWLHDVSKMGDLERHRSLLSQRTLGTGEWLLRSEDFLSWEAGVGGFLWLDGIIGAGKSTLASIVVDHLEKRSQDAGSSCCVYVYFHDNDDIQPTLESLYASLLEQLLRQLRPDHTISELLQEHFKQSKSHNLMPIAEEYLNLLAVESEDISKRFLIVDGLDNCYNTSDPKIQDRFLKGIRQLTDSWNVLVTSRSGIFTRARVNSDKEIAVEATPTDIKLYVEMRIEENDDMYRLTKEGQSADPGFKDHICETIVQKAQGMFLLAKLHMDSLAAQHLLGHFRKMLGKLPVSRENTFDAALQRIQKQGDFARRVAWHVLSWVVSSVRPVTVDEVRHAFADDKHVDPLNTEYIPSEDQLTSSCGGIVIVDKQRGLLRLVHDTVLKHVRDSEFLPKGPHREIALRCLAYLSSKEFAKASTSDVDVSEYTRKYPFLKYAADHWFNHFRRAEQTEDLEGRVLDFLKSNKCLSFSFQVRNSSLAKGVSSLHACAYLGADNLAKKLLDETRTRVDLTTEDRQTPLHWAIRYGHHTMGQLLIQNMAPINARDRQGNTPLHTAVAYDREGMVRQLIQAGAKLDILSKEKWTPLRWALRHGLKEVAIPLIQSKAEVDEEGSDGWVPLRLAAWHNQYDMVELLLKNGCDVNRRSSDGWTALRHAAQRGIKPLALLLLSNGADVDLRDQDGGLTPLRWAIMHGHQPVAELLLDNKADVNATCKDKLTPLIQAAKGGNKSAAWLLLGHEARTNDQDKDGLTALHYAVKQGHKSLMWLLVEADASLDLQDAQGRTPLHWAVTRGDFSTAWYLVEKGANVAIADAEGCEPLHLAAQEGQDKIIELLAENGGDLNQQDLKGLAALHHAAIGGHERAARLLIQKKAGLNTADLTQKTALHHAALRNLDTIVQALLEGGAETTLQDAEGLTALHHAVRDRGESFDTIFQLAKPGPGLDKKDSSGKTALMYAAQRGDDLATLGLVRAGADPLVQDAQHWTARDHAANGQHGVTVLILDKAVMHE